MIQYAIVIAILGIWLGIPAIAYVNVKRLREVFPNASRNLQTALLAFCTGFTVVWFALAVLLLRMSSESFTVHPVVALIFILGLLSMAISGPFIGYYYWKDQFARMRKPKE